MRFIWFLGLLGLVFTALTFCFCLLTGENIVEKYKKQFITTITSFLILLMIIYVTLIVVGLRY